MRVAILSDIHSNIHALDAVLEDLDRQNIDRILCTGDIVGYCAFPDEVVKRLGERNVGCVKGNHDAAATGGSMDGFNTYARSGVEYSRARLSPANTEFLRRLPENLKERVGERTVSLYHGSPADPLFEYVFPDELADREKEFASYDRSDVVAMGHTHLPTVYRGAQVYLNPGSVGQPRDRDPRAAYAVLDASGLEAEIRRVPYDVEAAAQAIIANGLPRYLAERLFYGT